MRCAAYQTRGCFEDEKNGRSYDYSNTVEASNYITRSGRHAERHQAEFVGLYGPAGAPEWTRGKEHIEEFWNRACQAERRADAQVAERVIIALPHELSQQQNIWALQDHLREFTRDGRVVSVAIHPAEHDQRNRHAHLMISNRGVDENGFKQSKAAEQQYRYLHRKEYVEGLRENWAHVANRHLERHGHEARVDHRSYQRQGVDREPTIHLGPGDADRERRGIHTMRGDHNRRIAERNAERQSLDQIVKAREAAPAEREKHGGAMQLGERPAISPEARAQLERDARADHVPSGWTKANVEDVARELSPEYRTASERMEALNEQLRRTEYGRRESGIDNMAYKARLEERRQEMGMIRRKLWDWGVVGDREATRWRDEANNAYSRYEKQSIRVKTLKDQLKSATAEVWRIYDQVKPAAERVLAERTRIAAAARETLRALDAGERVVEWRLQRPEPLSPAAEALRREQEALAARQDPEKVRQQLANLAQQRKATEREIGERRQQAYQDSLRRANEFWQQTLDAGRAEARTDSRLITDQDELGRLQRDARADIGQNGCPLTAEQVGRELSSQYNAIAEARDQLIRAADKARDDQRAWGNSRDSNMRAEQLRRHQIGSMKSMLHDQGIWRDEQLAEYQRGAAAADKKLDELRELSAQRDSQIKAVTREAAEIWQGIEPETQRVLMERQAIGQTARARLGQHYEAVAEQRREHERQHQRLLRGYSLGR